MKAHFRLRPPGTFPLAKADRKSSTVAQTSAEDPTQAYQSMPFKQIVPTPDNPALLRFRSTFTPEESAPFSDQGSGSPAAILSRR
jgi:hypothetical protein